MLMTILPEQGVLLSSRLRFRRSSSARPQHHVHISRSRFNQRGDSIQFNGFTAHDADENGAFVELQGFGVHGHNQVPLWQFWNRNARRRRRIPLAIAAERASIGRTTLIKIEKGDPGVALALYAMVLFVMGLTDRLADLVDPKNDSVGLQLEEERISNVLFNEPYLN